MPGYDGYRSRWLRTDNSCIGRFPEFITNQMYGNGIQPYTMIVVEQVGHRSGQHNDQCTPKIQK
ncbi:Protein of unknown function [Gryllus bimaculatus]|nr:Protein of unknown function [Gryllus bimaculatus]